MMAAALCRKQPSTRNSAFSRASTPRFSVRSGDALREQLRRLLDAEDRGDQRRGCDQQHDDRGLHGAVDQGAKEQAQVELAIDERRR